MTVKAIPDSMPSDKPRITLYIDQELKDALEVLAERDDRSVSNYVIQLIKLDVARARAAGELPPDDTQTQ
ncbi:MAG: ribbon-helix-helix protein, CopG family [Leptolyngbya sp. SIO4C1]|nr:ribbon-helix-helix protein, CopG family [Leptolyngbya sp. SIO4C1]